MGTNKLCPGRQACVAICSGGAFFGAIAVFSFLRKTAMVVQLTHSGVFRFEPVSHVIVG